MNEELTGDISLDLIRQYLEKDPSLLSNFLNILEYRNLRTEQVYYAKLAYQYDHLDIPKQCKEVRNAREMERSFWSYQSETLDKRRRETHNTALASFDGIVRTGRQSGLKPIYDGKTLTSIELRQHVEPILREQMTNAMFRMLYAIEDQIITKETNEQIIEVKRRMKEFNKTYKVSKSILEDESEKIDGGIEFDFITLFDKYFGNNETKL